MSLLRNITSGLRSLFRKEQVDRELNEELVAYLELAAEEKMKQGMSRKEAARAVRLESRGLDATKEVVRSLTRILTGWFNWSDTIRSVELISIGSPLQTSTTEQSKSLQFMGSQPRKPALFLARSPAPKTVLFLPSVNTEPDPLMHLSNLKTAPLWSRSMRFWSKRV